MFAKYFQSNDSQIPTPPPPPETAAKGYNSYGYSDLISSLQPFERKKILAELESPEIIAKAEQLKFKLANNQMTCLELDTTREMFLAALLLLQRNEISSNQLASLHLVDAAIRTLYTSPMSYLIYTFEKDGMIHKTFDLQKSSSDHLPKQVLRFKFDSIITPNDNTHIGDLPQRMQQPLVRRFFKLSAQEWNDFTKEMQHAPESEQAIHVLVAPEYGCWSSIIFKIQDVLECMQVLDWWKATKSGMLTEKIMVVPSFSMFQAAINAKAKALNRATLEFVPTYDYVSEDAYTTYKSTGRIPMTIYLPERDAQLRYNLVSKFRKNIDGHPEETAFAGAIHDTYHGFRELQMSENIAAARIRLSSIAKYHPDNNPNPGADPISTTIIDGELVFSYPQSRNTIFKPEMSEDTQKFGHIFYVESLRGRISDSLKRAFIRDMVEHSDEWKESFNLDRSDLLADEQKIYDEIRNEITPLEPVTQEMKL